MMRSYLATVAILAGAISCTDNNAAFEQDGGASRDAARGSDLGGVGGDASLARDGNSAPDMDDAAGDTNSAGADGSPADTGNDAADSRDLGRDGAIGDMQSDFGDDASTICDLQQLGTPCTDDDTCGGGFCFKPSKSAQPAAIGVCSCACSVDNAQSAENDDSCPAQGKFVCAKVPVNGEDRFACLQRCIPALGGSSCPAGIACEPESARFSGTAQDSVCLYPRCARDLDCPLSTTTLCNPALNQGGSNPACSENALCVGSNTSIGLCIEAGVCDTASGLCAARRDKTGTFRADAAIGDPCRADVECGANQRCLGAFNNANGDVVARNGYCITTGCAFADRISDLRCDAGSRCMHFDKTSLCLKRCELGEEDDCRGHESDRYGDYQCQAWDNFNNAQQGLFVADGPVCFPATLVRCSDLEPFGLGCNFLGKLPQNPTNMACRDLGGRQTLNPFDAQGYCLDTTNRPEI